MQSEEPVLKSFFGEPLGDVVGDFIEATAAGRDAKFVKRLEHGRADLGFSKA